MQAYAEPIIKSYTSLNQDNISKKSVSTGIQGRSVGSVIFRSRFGCLDFRFRHIRCDLFVAFSFVVSVADVIVVFGDVVDGWLRFWLPFLLFLKLKRWKGFLAEAPRPLEGLVNKLSYVATGKDNYADCTDSFLAPTSDSLHEKCEHVEFDLDCSAHGRAKFKSSYFLEASINVPSMDRHLLGHMTLGLK